MKQPPCASWRIWIGNEVEGHVSRGKRTLFLRKFSGELKTVFQLQTEFPDIDRIWFCEEFASWNDSAIKAHTHVLNALGMFKEVCVCLNVPLTLSDKEFCENILEGVEEVKPLFYFKFDLPAKLMIPGTQICVGPKYRDEAFTLGQGQLVTAGDYLNDICIA